MKLHRWRRIDVATSEINRNGRTSLAVQRELDFQPRPVRTHTFEPVPLADVDLLHAIKDPLRGLWRDRSRRTRLGVGAGASAGEHQEAGAKNVRTEAPGGPQPSTLPGNAVSTDP